MNAASASHLEVVRRWLQLMEHHREDVGRVEPLRSGRSGASTFRIQADSEELILKIAPAGSPPHILERGRREVLFYRRLSPALPVRTPEVLASHGPSPEGCALLLRSHAVLPEIVEWGPELYRTAARDLAALHATYLKRVDELDGFDWLRDPDGPDPRSDAHGAHAAWHALWSQPRLAAAFDPKTVRSIEAGLDRIEQLRSRIGHLELPLTLVHGDAHHENVVINVDCTWLWADWQEVGFGLGTDDLSFFHQRAAAAGGSPDLSDMLRAYRAGLERRCGTRVSLETLHAAVALCEAIQRLVEWPAYLTAASEAVVRRHVESTVESLEVVERLPANADRSSRESSP